MTREKSLDTPTTIDLSSRRRYTTVIYLQLVSVPKSRAPFDLRPILNIYRQRRTPIRYRFAVFDTFASFRYFVPFTPRTLNTERLEPLIILKTSSCIARVVKTTVWYPSRRPKVLRTSRENGDGEGRVNRVRIVSCSLSRNTLPIALINARVRNVKVYTRFVPFKTTEI